MLSEEDNSFSLGKNKKLIPNLDNKRKYKLHYQNLELDLNLGLQMKKNDRIIEFKQDPFLKPYIERNTDLRREAEKEGNKIKKQKAKLRNNSIFGKLIKNPMNKIDVKIVTTRKQSLKWLYRPTFKRENQFRDRGIKENKREKKRENQFRDGGIAIEEKK